MKLRADMAAAPEAAAAERALCPPCIQAASLQPAFAIVVARAPAGVCTCIACSDGRALPHVWRQSGGKRLGEAAPLGDRVALRMMLIPLKTVYKLCSIVSSTTKGPCMLAVVPWYLGSG